MKDFEQWKDKLNQDAKKSPEPKGTIAFPVTLPKTQTKKELEDIFERMLDIPLVYLVPAMAEFSNETTSRILKDKTRPSEWLLKKDAPIERRYSWYKKGDNRSFFAILANLVGEFEQEDIDLLNGVVGDAENMDYEPEDGDVKHTPRSIGASVPVIVIKEDHELDMARVQVGAMADDLGLIAAALGSEGESDLPAWVQAKLTSSAADISAVANYMRVNPT